MIAVIFEVRPAPGQVQHYLDLAAALRADLARVEGFISLERFQSLSDPGKLLSLSFFRDEEAVRQWRSLAARRAGQAPEGLFAQHRLRMAGVIHDAAANGASGAARDDRRVASPRAL